MKVYFKIDGANTGKSSLAVYEFLKDPENSLLYTNERLVMYKRLKEYSGFKEAYSNIFKNVVAYSPSAGCSRSKNRIIFDSFFNFKNYKELWAASMPSVYKDGEVYVFSSLNNLSEDWEFVNGILTNNPNAVLMPATADAYKAKEISVCIKVAGVETKLFEDYVPQIIIDEVIKSYRNAGKDDK